MSDAEPPGWDPAKPDSTASANRLEVSRIYIELESRGFTDAARRLRYCDPPSRRMLLARSLRAKHLDDADVDKGVDDAGV